MNKSIGPTNVKDQRAKRWHDKRMRKKGYNLGDKKLMNSSSYEASRTRKTSSKKGRTLRQMVSSRSNDKGNILR